MRAKSNIMGAVFLSFLFFSLSAWAGIAPIDLGSLGGGVTAVYGINNHGQIYGTSLDSTGLKWLFVLDPEDENSDGLPDTWFRDENSDGANDLMHIVSTGYFRLGKLFRKPSPISDSGLFVIEGTVFEPTDSDGDGRADRWIEGGYLGDFIGKAINESGIIAGGALIGSEMRAVIWHKQTGIANLGTLGGDYSYAIDINEAGQVLGASNNAAGEWRSFLLTPLARPDGTEGFPFEYWKDENADGINDLMKDIGTLGGSGTDAWDLNENGYIVGESENSEGAFFPFITSFIDSIQGNLDLIESNPDGFAFALNDRNEVVGWHPVVDPATSYTYYHPFYWHAKTGFNEILPEYQGDFFAVDINNSGQVVITEYSPISMEVIRKATPGHAAIWTLGSGLTRLDWPVELDPELIFKEYMPLKGVKINESGHTIGNAGQHALLWISDNTQTGSGVSVSPVDGTTGEPSGVTITYDTVEGGGTTTVITHDTGAPPPEGFKIGSPPIYYNIETTAAYSGNTQVCIEYGDIQYGNESKLRLFHQSTTGGWEDITDPGYPDAVGKVICGTTSSFSDFAVMEAAYSFSGFLQPVENPPVVNVAKAGRTIPLKWQIGDENGSYLRDFELVNLSYQKVSCPAYGEESEIDEAIEDSGNSGLHYDYDAEQYRFNWDTSKGKTGCYRLTLELFGFDRHSAEFELR